MFSDLAATGTLHSAYHYTPTRWICITFLSLFGISTATHIVQAIVYRAWYMLPTAALCGTLEIIGWIARLSSSRNPHALLPYEIQMTATIIGPTPLLAANFLTLGKVVEFLGPQYCRLPPRIYSMLFLSCDLIALCVQAAGGGMASIAVRKNEDPSNGGNIMLGGIAFQLAAITAYVCLAGEFIVRYTIDRPVSTRHNPSLHGVITPRLQLLVAALGFNTFFLVIRAIYRTIELNNGFSGSIISTQWYFNVFDGAMVSLAILIVNFAHPGMLLKGADDLGDKEKGDTGSEVQLKLMGTR
ncbi:RTA1 like protein-domain-containing protein [Mycena galopus ATCC 62051]|nr:RTA1 like protein-domain-containing protein [Mycena galopus ATCC 62051]